MSYDLHGDLDDRRAGSAFVQLTGESLDGTRSSFLLRDPRDDRRQSGPETRSTPGSGVGTYGEPLPHEDSGGRHWPCNVDTDGCCCDWNPERAVGTLIREQEAWGARPVQMTVARLLLTTTEPEPT